MERVAPLVHVEKWTDLFPFIRISHQALELLFWYWLKKHISKVKIFHLAAEGLVRGELLHF